MITIETLNSNNWVPVELTHDSTRPVSFSSYTQQYTAGFALHFNPLMANVQDVSVQYDAFTALLGPNSLTACFDEATLEFDPNLAKNNMLQTFDGKAMTFNKTSLVPELCAVGDDQYHLLNFVDDKVEILYQYGDGYYLTVETGVLVYKPKSQVHRDTQQFYYTLSGDKLTLTSSLTSLTSQYTVTYDNTACAVVLSTNAFLASAAVSNLWFWTLPNNVNSITTGFDYAQYWHQYYNRFGPSTNKTAPTINSSQTQLLTANYLATFPIRPSIETTRGGITLVPLKNTLNYNYHQLPSSTQRMYTTLSFPQNQTDSNQEAGLIFHDNTHEIRMPCDKATVFHFPYNAEAHALSASTLATMGATPALTPAYSDRISKRLFGYECSTYDKNTYGNSNGTFLCSWLSGDQTNCQWVDRWYDSDHVTQGYSLIAMIVSSGSATNQDYVWDVTSTMMLEPGASYSYFRQGVQTQTQTVRQQTQDKALIEIDTWYPPTDTSLYNHQIFAHNGDQVVANTPYTTDGTNCLSIATIPQIAVKNQVTLAGWVYADNWLSANANQLFGNFFESGLGITYSSGIYSIENIVFADSNYGFITMLDNEYLKLQQQKLLAKTATPNITDIATTRNFSKWILDSANHTVYCTDYSNTIIGNVVLPASSNFQYLQIDSSDVVYTLDLNTHTLVKFTLQGIVSSYSVDVSANNFIVNGNDQVILSLTTPGTVMMADSQGILWRLVGNNVYKGSRLVFHSGPLTSGLTIDTDDNVWVARGTNKLYKLNSDGILLKETTLPNSFTSNSISLNLIREQTPIGLADFVLVTSATANKMVKVSMSGNIVTCIDLRALANIDTYTYPNNIAACTRGDITGYDVHRKFVRLPRVQANVRINDLCNGQTHTISTSIAASSLTNGWHHFALTFNSNEGVLNLYVDGIVVDRHTFDSNVCLIDYKYGSPFVIGGDSGKFGLLKDELGFTNTSGFIGKFDGIRYFGDCLNQDQIRALMAAKTPFNDLLWAVETNNKYPQVEHVMSWFSHRLQTHKSNYFDIVLKQLDVQDPETRQVIEQTIRQAISQIKPGHTQMRQIVWM